MSISYSLSIAGTWQNTFRKWASELRNKVALEASDFDLRNNSHEPIITAAGSMTITTSSKRFNYDVKGKVCYCSMELGYTTGGSASAAIYVTLPLVGKSGWNQAVSVFFNGVNFSGWGYIASGSSSMTMGRVANQNFSLTAQGAIGNFFYEIN